MPLPNDLLDLSNHLASTSASSATEAIYRRVISTAYYAAFHLLSEAAGDCLGRDTFSGLDRVLQRQLSHTQMKKSAELFARGFGGLPDQIRRIVPDPVPFELRNIGRYFAWLQGKRHEADYSTSVSFNRRDAMEAAETASQLFLLWKRLITREKEYAQIFLISLFLDLEKKR